MTISFRLKISSLTFWFMVFMLLFAMITAICGNNYRINDVVLVFTYFGIALIPVYVKLNYRLFSAFAWSIMLFFAIAFFTVPANKVFAGVSENNISSWMLIALSYYVIACFQNNKKPTFILFMLAFAFTIWGVGRAGIISVGFLLMAYPFMINIRKDYKWLFFLFLASLPFVIYLFYPDVFRLIFQRFYSQGGLVSARTGINAEYLQDCFSSLSYALFGAPLNEIRAITDLPGDSLSSHNSFIRAHVYYGLCGFFLLMILLSYTMHYFLKTGNFLFGGLLIALLARSFFDEQAFHGPFDPLIYYLIFFSIKDVHLATKSLQNKLITR